MWSFFMVCLINILNSTFLNNHFGYKLTLIMLGPTLQEKKGIATGTKRRFNLNRRRSCMCRPLLRRFQPPPLISKYRQAILSGFSVVRGGFNQQVACLKFGGLWPVESSLAFPILFSITRWFFTNQQVRHTLSYSITSFHKFRFRFVSKLPIQYPQILRSSNLRLFVKHKLQFSFRFNLHLPLSYSIFVFT
jgi:hypothetical protein